MKKSEYFILTPSYQNDQKDTTVWPTQKKVSTQKREKTWKPAKKTDFLNGIIERNRSKELRNKLKWYGSYRMT